MTHKEGVLADLRKVKAIATVTAHRLANKEKCCSELLTIAYHTTQTSPTPLSVDKVGKY